MSNRWEMVSVEIVKAMNTEKNSTVYTILDSLAPTPGVLLLSFRLRMIVA